MNNRRSQLGGGTYSFTVNLAERSRWLLVEPIEVLRAFSASVKERHSFHIDAMVMLPDHLQAYYACGSTLSR